MFKYILKRLSVAIPTILLLIIISFFLMHSAPGGPFTSERPLPDEVLKNINEKYGLDKPIYIQMFSYVWGIVTDFDFGPSFRYKDRTVNDIIAQGFPVTLKYGSWAFLWDRPLTLCIMMTILLIICWQIYSSLISRKI